MGNEIEELSDMDYYDVSTITREEVESTLIMKASSIQRMEPDQDEDHRGREDRQL